MWGGDNLRRIFFYRKGENIERKFIKSFDKKSIKGTQMVSLYYVNDCRKYQCVRRDDIFISGEEEICLNSRISMYARYAMDKINL